MQIKAITVNAADTAVAGHGIQGNGALDANQAKTENSNVFGPEYKVTISREGKLLSRRQAAQEEAGTRNGQNVREERKQLHQQEQAELAKEIRDGYREELAASIGREMGVQERMADLEESGRWYIDTADSITKSVLQKSAGIRAAMDDGSFSDEQIAEMMQDFRADMEGLYDEVKDFREFGIQVLGNVREARIEHIADNPLKGMQETKNSMMLSALDAGLGEARQGVLDKSSQELADEVKELIDERNDVDRIPQDKEEAMEEDMEKEMEEQLVETEGEEQT